MIAQHTDRTGDSLKQRRIGPYGRLKRIPCAVRRQARACAIHEKAGLAPAKPLLQPCHAPISWLRQQFNPQRFALPRR